MIQDQIFKATIGEHYFACLVSPDGVITSRTDVPEYKTRFEEALNYPTLVALVPAIPNLLYPTGKNSALEIAASIMTIAPQIQIVEAPKEVIKELRRITETPNPETIASALQVSSNNPTKIFSQPEV